MNNNVDKRVYRGLSVQDKAQSDSNRGKQTRQLDQDSQQFASLVADVRKTLTIPPDEQIDQAGALANSFRELLLDFQDGGLDGFNNTLQVMCKTNRRVTAALAWLEDQDQETKQEQDDNKTRINQRGKRVFKVITEADVDQFPDLKWAISGILTAESVSLIFGDSNVGKTFFALQVARCIAREQQWFGRNVKGGYVLYIYAEGKYGLKPRLRALRQFYNEGMTDKIHFIPFPVHLLNDRLTLLETVADLEAEYNLNYALVVIDTISNCALGINQNDQAEVIQVLDTAHDIASNYHAHVMVIHHTNKQGGANGSAALKNHVDTQIELKRPLETSPVIVAHCEKQRDGAPKFDDILLELQIVDLGENPETLEPITSCVMVLSENKAPAIEKAEQESAIMLAILKEHEPISQTQWEEKCKARGISQRTYKARREYLETHNIVTCKKAPNGKGFEYRVALDAESIIESITGGSDD